MTNHDSETEDFHDLDDPMRSCLCMECCERRGEIGNLDDDDQDASDLYAEDDHDGDGESAIDLANKEERAMKAMGF